MTANYLAENISTAELIKILKKYAGRYIEASLSLGHGFSTHFLMYDANTKILQDTGCESKLRRLCLTEFAKEYDSPNYPNARWFVWKNGLNCENNS